MRLFAVILAVLLLTPVSAVAQPAQPTFAYYYIWYDKTSWDRAKSDYPALGRYSSDDSRIMREHIREAKDAGITGFIVSWKSSPANDRRLQTLVSVARAADFRLAIIYEALDFQRNPLTIGHVADDLRLFRDRYGTDPVFSMFGKPVVIWSGSWMFSADDIARASAPVRDKLLVLGSERSVEGYERIANAVDGDAYYWSSMDPQRDTGAAAKLAAMSDAVHRHHGLWFAPFAPGFDARMIGGTRVVDRRDGDTLRYEYDIAVKSSPDALSLISWNEFSENSHVEPSVNHGDRYLAMLRHLTSTPVQELGPLADDSSSAESVAGTSGTLVVGGGLLGLTVLLLLRRRRHVAIVALSGMLTASCMVGVLSADSPRASESSAVRDNAPPGQQTQYYLGAKPVRSAASITIATAGDIACPPDPEGLSDEEADQARPCQEKTTADLVDAMRPDAVLPLGDNQYPNGSLARYQQGYEKTWGRFKDISYPVVGNHEYGTSGAKGYFDYFGAAAGDREAGYYSYDLGDWHMIALNSECERIGGCSGGSPQEQWLRADLAAHPAKCTLAYFHQPRWSSGTHGNNPNYDAFWRAMYDAGVDVVLAGHDHDYERFAPLRPDGSIDATGGIRQFVVGTGGDSHYRIRTVVPGSESRIEGVYGVLGMTLRPDGYDWRFAAEPGVQTGDSGTGRCSVK
ncbi:metallophosphoesterase [Lentzea nigeriaca]|uniref:metallophosphoesterase n=1 Tax=Lentzea nigeriaca TaxID=1128665 RepID=UPI0019566741|nr:metallophosphoesterase [Lentzea nigeriaca]